MKAQWIRFLIAVLAMAAAGIAFMMLDGWTAWVAAAGLLLMGWSFAEAAFRRLADAETKRADLEERVRNSHL
ncbi:MAG: hypothetical protein J0J01_14955 [Reyranella sp.]|uniref:hypothetical protein n=1 Tax=Reyranella sp. TaxID=1929291 RepID=UPI001AC9BC10|nr:hypothetical protein [Reyranella sp.]MBN9088207.1 hypothetical protein [Reyranella sp.]